MKALRKGDTLVVWRLDRLGRSLRDLIQLTQDLQSRGVGLESLTERIDTVSTTGKLVFHVFAALAEFERNLIRERTLAGLKAARARGRNGGRPKKLNPKELKTIRTLLRSNEVPVQDIAAQFKVNRSTLYRNVTAT
jgi:DNA invertase Pin-like site-specific DNA recombinase